MTLEEFIQDIRNYVNALNLNGYSTKDIMWEVNDKFGTTLSESQIKSMIR
jgi:hypothetical protein